MEGELTFGVKIKSTGDGSLVNEAKASQEALEKLSASVISAASGAQAYGAASKQTAEYIMGMSIAESNALDKAWALANGYKEVEGQLTKLGEATQQATHGNAGMTRELIVLGHEALNGNFSRIPGSMMVLAEKSGLAASSMLGLASSMAAPAAALAAIAAPVAVGIYAWEAYKQSVKDAAEQASAFDNSVRGLSLGLDEQNALLIKRNTLQAAGITGQDDKTGDALISLQVKMTRLAEIIRDTASVTSGESGAMRELTAVTEQYNILANKVAETNALEKAYKDQENATRNAAASAKKYYTELMADQENMLRLYDDYGKRQITALDNEHARKLISDREYYDQKHELAMQAMLIDMSIMQTEEAIAKARGDKKKADATQSHIEEIQQRLALEQAAGSQYDSILRQSAKSALQIDKEKYQKEIDDLNEAHNRKYLDDEEFYRRLEELKKNHAKAMYANDTEAMAMIHAFKVGDMQDEFDNTAGFLAKLSAMGAAHHKSMFDLNKAASEAQIVVHTYSAAVKAFDDSGGGPWGFAAAAASVAWGMAQLDQVKNSSFSGGSVSTSGGGGGGMASAPAPASPRAPASPQTVGVAAQAPSVVNLTIAGANNPNQPQFTYAQIVNDLVPLLNKAGTNGVVINVVST